jgi:CheY-like chemotaxis protein
MREIPDTYQWENKQILIVDDDESSAFLLGVILKDTGARIEYTTDGEAAVEFVRNHPETDLVLMDVQLPEMDGFTATREIKSISRRIVVIAQTAYAFTIDTHHAKDAGCDEIMAKPLNPSVLLHKMSQYLT